MPPKISVVMPTYNQEAYFEQAIESAIRQVGDFSREIIIAEDCSTDRTPAIAEAYRQRHPELIRIARPTRNLGPKQNFVQALSVCRGEYVALLEGDDYWTRDDKLQKQIEFLDDAPQFAICAHLAETVDEHGTRTGVYPDPHWYSREDFGIEDLLRANFLPTCSVVFRRKNCETFPSWFHEFPILTDWPLHILNAEHGAIRLLHEEMGAYRVHSGGVWTSASDDARFELTFALFTRLRPHLGVRHESHLSNQLELLCSAAARKKAEKGDWRGAWRLLRKIDSMAPPKKLKLLLRVTARAAVAAGRRSFDGLTHEP